MHVKPLTMAHITKRKYMHKSASAHSLVL